MKVWLTLGLLVASALIAISCGSDQAPAESVSDTSAVVEVSGPQTRVVKPSDRIFEVSQFEAAGLKHSKDYKTAGLPDASRVALFFWKVDGTAVQYEVRFYDSHDQAVASGTSYAIEGAGPEAIIDPDFARYTEGLRDRRTIVHTRGSPTPRYGDFVIFGNTIALCEGRDEEQASERCARLVEVLEAVP